MKEDRTPKVFVAQENPNLNYMDAEKFGDVFFIDHREYTPLKNSLVNKEIIKNIREKMKEFDPDFDYLLLTGGPVILGYVFYLACERGEVINLLQWDGIQRGYVPIRFNVNQ